MVVKFKRFDYVPMPNDAKNTLKEDLYIKLLLNLQDELFNFCNDEDFNATCEAIDDYNGEFLEWRRWWDFSVEEEKEEMLNFFTGQNCSKMELLRKVFYGNFNLNHNFIRLNPYGNLETCEYKDYSNLWDWGNIIESILNEFNNYNDFYKYNLPSNVLKCFQHYEEQYDILELGV